MSRAHVPAVKPPSSSTRPERDATLDLVVSACSQLSEDGDPAGKASFGSPGDGVDDLR